MDTSAVFDRMAARYDGWYDRPGGAAVFASELACLHPLIAQRGPRLEVGVGSGRFAAALGMDIAIDPVESLLELARQRGVGVVRGAGEQLPFRSGVFRTVLIVLTLCFVDDLATLLREARRVIRADGAVVLGMVPADSPWGTYYRRHAADGPFCSTAEFVDRHRAATLVRTAGLRIESVRSTLHRPPAPVPRTEPVYPSDTGTAGFVAWRCVPVDALGPSGSHATAPRPSL